MIDSNFLTNYFPLSRVTLGETYSTYPTRQVIHVHAAEGEFVAKIDTQPLPYAEALVACAALDFLSARRFPHAPGLLRTRAGEPLYYAGGQSVTVLEYIDGGHPEDTPSGWHAVGQAAARLNAIPDFPNPYGVPTREVIRELRDAAAGHPAREQFLVYIDLLEPLLDYPRQGLVHGELHLSNAMRRASGEIVIIDWDEAGTGATILEPGLPLIIAFLSTDFTFRPDVARAYYSGYYGEKLPGSAETEMLFRAGLLHALRYMQFYDQQKRWERVCYAVAHKDELLAQIF